MSTAPPVAVRERGGAGAELSRAQRRLVVVIPCYREREHIMHVLEAIPSCVSSVYCVDDGCPLGTGRHIEAHCRDPRVHVLYHQSNQGVGAAMRSGYRAALADGGDVLIKLDGDGQMDPREIPQLVRPIVNGLADYTKGNRFFRLEGLTSMPPIRLFGNIVLSFVSKLSTGYWQLFDPNNGYTAIDARVLEMLPLDAIDDGYFFESDMLFRLNTLRAVVLDVPMRARYGNEKSSIKLPKVTVRFAVMHAVNFCKRLFYNYFLRGFSVASIEWIAGPLLLVFGVAFGLTQWIASASTGVAATAGTVMLASLPTIVGMQMLLSAIHFDIGNEPSIPLCQRLARAHLEE